MAVIAAAVPQASAIPPGEADAACDLAVISDCHLGTRHCDGAALLRYLRSIRPRRLIINGDLCDLGCYLTAHWPAAHLAVLRRVVALAAEGCDVVLVLGNHDAALAHSPLVPPGIRVVREHSIAYGGRRLRIVHGDIYDGACASPLLRWLGGHGYGLLQRCEGVAGRLAGLAGLPPPALVGPIKRRVPGAEAAIRRFAAAATADARSHGDDGILTGHIHAPVLRESDEGGRPLLYANSGDWVEHRTAIEGRDGCLHLVSVPPGGGERATLAERPASGARQPAAEPCLMSLR